MTTIDRLRCEPTGKLARIPEFHHLRASAMAHFIAALRREPRGRAVVGRIRVPSQAVELPASRSAADPAGDGNFLLGLEIPQDIARRHQNLLGTDNRLDHAVTQRRRDWLMDVVRIPGTGEANRIAERMTELLLVRVGAGLDDPVTVVLSARQVSLLELWEPRGGEPAMTEPSDLSLAYPYKEL